MMMKEDAKQRRKLARSRRFAFFNKHFTRMIAAAKMAGMHTRIGGE
jgi:hypothetical protein